MSVLLSFESAGCRKGGKQIVKPLSFSVQSGDIITVLGRSGAGKSTLLRMAVALDDVTEGHILFEGLKTIQWDIAELRRRMGMVLQLPYLFTGTVMDNLLYGPRIHQRKHGDETAFAKELLDDVGLPTDLLERNTSNLSVGQQMRVSLGRTLANRPDILLLDEPTASLDLQSERHVLNLIKQLNKKSGYTVDDGELVLEGPIEKIVRDNQSPLVRKMMAGLSS
jgi:UDP-glucose/iron transport system ATP-binding protein